MVQRGHGRERICPRCPQVGQAAQNEGSGRAQAAHSGSAVVPPRTCSLFPQFAQRAQRCLQAAHHGWPVAMESQQGASRPQIEQVRIGA
jgi:hypothetical protein